MWRVLITPLSFLCCFSLYVSSIVFICGHISTISLHVLFSLTIFSADEFSVFFTLWWYTPISICMSGNLHYCYIYFSSVSGVIIYLLVDPTVFLWFPILCCNHYSFYHVSFLSSSMYPSLLPLLYSLMSPQLYPYTLLFHETTCSFCI